MCQSTIGRSVITEDTSRALIACNRGSVVCSVGLPLIANDDEESDILVSQSEIRRRICELGDDSITRPQKSVK
jgi:hypothetical protein